jgi:hypothetical protein
MATPWLTTSTVFAHAGGDRGQTLALGWCPVDVFVEALNQIVFAVQHLEALVLPITNRHLGKAIFDFVIRNGCWCC